MHEPEWERGGDAAREFHYSMGDIPVDSGYAPHGGFPASAWNPEASVAKQFKSLRRQRPDVILSILAVVAIFVSALFSKRPHHHGR